MGIFQETSHVILICTDSYRCHRKKLLCFRAWDGAEVRQVPQVQFVEKIVEVPEVRIQEAGVRLLHVFVRKTNSYMGLSENVGLIFPMK